MMTELKCLGELSFKVRPLNSLSCQRCKLTFLCATATVSLLLHYRITCVRVIASSATGMSAIS